MNLIFLLAFGCQAQPKNLPDLIPFTKDSKWGYMNKDRKVIIQPKFQEVELFKEDYAFVKIGDKRGVINKKGNYIISPNHDLEYGMPFFEGLIPAKDPKTGLTGYMDKKGQWQIKPQFNRGYYFSKGVTAVVIDNGKNWVFINKEGKALSKPRVYAPSDHFDFGMHVFRTYTGQGLINSYGKEVLPPLYTEVNIMKSNLIHIREGQESGFVDSTGKVILPAKYSFEGADKGYIAVTLDKKGGVIDSTGKFVVPLMDKAVLLLGDGLGFVVDSVSKGLSMDIYGHFITMKNEAVSPMLKLNGKPEVCSESFCLIIQMKFDLNNPSQDFNYGYSLINLKGEKVTKDDYVFVGSFHDGLALVVDKNKKAGFIDTSGKKVIKCQYDYRDAWDNPEIPTFNKGLCLVSRNGKTFYIDTAGNEFIAD